MKLRLPAFLCLLAFLLPLSAPRAQAQEAVSFDYFYDNLRPYGEWVEVPDYGLCWHPRDVAEDWAPYTDGYWAYTDAGWTWVSYEDFGDIVYHYGRWVRVEDEGWCWVPDTDWGPAWVSWRNNDDYVGWAPLPPEAHFQPSVGISVWADDTYDIGPGYYQFCRVRDFGAPVIREVCLPRSRNIGFFRDTVNVTNITINSGYGTPFCGGPRYDFFSRRVARPIPTLKLVRETNIVNINNTTNIVNIRNGGGDRRAVFASVQRGNALLVPAPRIQPIADRRAPAPTAVPTRVLPAARVARGWGDVQSPQDRDQIRNIIRQQNKGATPDTTPARAFNQAEIKVVPTKPNAVALKPRVPPPVVPPTRGPEGLSRVTDDVPGRPVIPGQPPVTVPKGKPVTTLPPNRGAGNVNRVAATPAPVAPLTRPVTPLNPARVPTNPVTPIEPFRRGNDGVVPSSVNPRRGASTAPVNPGNSADAARDRAALLQQQQADLKRSQALRDQEQREQSLARQQAAAAAARQKPADSDRERIAHPQADPAAAARARTNAAVAQQQAAAASRANADAARQQAAARANAAAAQQGAARQQAAAAAARQQAAIAAARQAQSRPPAPVARPGVPPVARPGVPPVPGATPVPKGKKKD